MDGLHKLVKSRRFWSAFATLAALIANELFRIEIDAPLIMGIGAVLVGGYAIEDAAKARNGQAD